MPSEERVMRAIPSPLSRLTKGHARQREQGTHMVDLIDSANCHVIAGCVYEPYADEILAAVRAMRAPAGEAT